MRDRFMMEPDIYGRWRPQPDTTGMTSPARCTYCQHVYDLGKVTVTARYTDCSMWHCPGCKTLVDDRGETGWKSRKDYVVLPRTPQLIADEDVSFPGDVGDIEPLDWEF
jgi:hypothetical protein